MSVGIVVLMAAVSVAAFMVTFCRVLGMAFLLRHANVVDVLFTISIGVLLAGTLTGVLVAVMAGLMLAIVLTVLKRIVRLADARKPHDSEFNADGWVYNQAPYI